MLKQSYISGRSFDNDFLSPRTPIDLAAEEYKDYASQKAKENRTGILKALAVGGGIGAGTGALISRPLMGKGTALPMAIVLGAIGALSGIGLKNVDDNLIETAKQVMNSDDPTRSAVRQVVKDMAVFDRYAPIHDEMMRESVRGVYKTAAVKGALQAPPRLTLHSGKIPKMKRIGYKDLNDHRNILKKILDYIERESIKRSRK